MYYVCVYYVGYVLSKRLCMTTAVHCEGFHYIALGKPESSPLVVLTLSQSVMVLLWQSNFFVYQVAVCGFAHLFRHCRVSVVVIHGRTLITRGFGAMLQITCSS